MFIFSTLGYYTDDLLTRKVNAGALGLLTSEKFRLFLS
jgi:hypothetical protein